jgi:hypothetical protein
MTGAPCNFVPLKNPRPAVIIEVFPQKHPNIHRVHSGMPCEDEANKLQRCCKRVDSLSSLSEEEHRITVVRLGLDDCCHLFETTEEGCKMHGPELEVPKIVPLESHHKCHWEAHPSECEESPSSEDHSQEGHSSSADRSDHESRSSTENHHKEHDDDDDSDDHEGDDEHNDKDKHDDEPDSSRSHTDSSSSSSDSEDHEEPNSTHSQSDVPSVKSLAKTAHELEERVESLEEKLNASSASADELTSTTKELTKEVVEATALVNNAEAKDVRIQAQLKHIALHNAEQLVQLHSEIEHFAEEHKEVSLKSAVNAARLSDIEARVGHIEAEHK